MNYAERSLELHKKYTGKLEIASKVSLETMDDLAVAYTPGVAEPCNVIAKDPSQAMSLTMKGNTVAVVTDGSAVLGLGNIGPLAALPVMEGKAILYKKFAGIDAIPICLATQDTEEIISVIKMIAPTFGGIHLEDISAPRCFEIEERLNRELDMPVMHDDQHGTAVVVLAGLLNALKVVGKKLSDVRIVISGAGAAGNAIAWILHEAGATKISVLDSKGVIGIARDGMNQWKDKLVRAIADTATQSGMNLADAVRGADVFIGVSQANLLSQEMVKSMAGKAIVFAMANPVPEIMPDDARVAGAVVVASGRSDFPNQVNNVLAYPGMFLGALRNGVKHFSLPIKVNAAIALASLLPEPTAEKILPSVFEADVAEAIARVIV
ncbi:MAG: NADP-dependent malic enzyme [Patescibacteria group bacterium]